MGDNDTMQRLRNLLRGQHCFSWWFVTGLFPRFSWKIWSSTVRFVQSQCHNPKNWLTQPLLTIGLLANAQEHLLRHCTRWGRSPEAGDQLGLSVVLWQWVCGLRAAHWCIPPSLLWSWNDHQTLELWWKLGKSGLKQFTQLTCAWVGADPGFWSGGPSGVLTSWGPEPKICSKWGFSLKIAFEKILGARGAPGSASGWVSTRSGATLSLFHHKHEPMR